MNRYKLNPGEIVKIGRITMRIRDIKFKDKYTSPNNSINEKGEKIGEKKKKKNQKKEEMMTLIYSEKKLQKKQP